LREPFNFAVSNEISLVWGMVATVPLCVFQQTLARTLLDPGELSFDSRNVS
jgi:hypothetical protein